MKHLEKVKLIELIGRALQARMTFSQIDSYFSNYGIPTGHQPSYNSKYVYVSEILSKVDDTKILEIANELEIEHPAVSKIPIVRDGEANFWKPGHFRLFISHLASFKAKITMLKKELEKYGISSFVAHEDIEPTKEWQTEIEKGLFSMESLCAVLIPKFKESNWTDQEIGVAIGRGILVIPVRRGLDPYGFIGKYQGFQAQNKSIREVAEGIFLIICSNAKTKNIMVDKLTELFLMSTNEIEAMQRVTALKKIALSVEKVTLLKTKAIENKNLKSASILKELNELLLGYGEGQIEIADFDKKTTTFKWSDDLPF